MKIAIFGNDFLSKGLSHSMDTLLRLLEARGAQLLGEEEAQHADVALSIGGDGTFLHTAHAVAQHNIPIMGVNAGHLGYLTTTDVANAEVVADALLAGDYNVECRAMLRLDMPTLEQPAYALNEIALLRRNTSSMIKVNVCLDDVPLTACKGDGLLVCTPTGSTAYNLSVGGPVLQPQSRCFVVAPISPHALTMRPVVISDSSTLQIISYTRAEGYQVSVDGETFSVPNGTTIAISKAEFSTRVIMLKTHRFADVLRTKLMWGVENRNS